MEQLVGYIAYPVFQLSMFVGFISNNIGIALLAVAIPLLCIYSVLDGLKLNKKNLVAVVTFILPFIVWFAWISLPIENAGVGNFILELCALITLAVLISVIYKLHSVIGLKKHINKCLLPQIWLSLAVVIFRIFMPFVGK